MEFIKKTELFFIQLQYCLTIEAEPILQAENGNYSLLLKPDIFFKLINDFNIDYPFIPENKIIELKSLMSKENINTKDALKIIENYKKQYWFLDTVVMFEPVTEKLKRTLKSIDINISEKEINIELINYQKHLQAKRESIYIDLINEIQSLPPQRTETETEQQIPKTFEELFYNPEHAEPCLKILNELQPPVIDAINNYIGKAKGVFPLWVRVLKNHKPEPLIKHFKDAVYKDLLNQKVNGLNLSKDASEFRKQYKRIETDKIELDIKAILSQYSQSGKLGK
jgi:hypothetical protein